MNRRDLRKAKHFNTLLSGNSFLRMTQSPYPTKRLPPNEDGSETTRASVAACAVKTASRRALTLQNDVYREYMADCAYWNGHKSHDIYRLYHAIDMPALYHDRRNR
jgi:hypothetical protein